MLPATEVPSISKPGGEPIITEFMMLRTELRRMCAPAVVMEHPADAYPVHRTALGLYVYPQSAG